MYRSFENGSVEMVGDLPMHIPPIGYVFNPLSGELEKRDILKRSKKASEQYWERPKLPAWYKKRLTEEQAKQEHDPEYVDFQLEALRQQEWDRRLCGLWFMNNGIPTYITGPHYYYLTYYPVGNPVNDGYPNYWDTDRKWFYFKEYCFQDPDCVGFIYLVKRRAGKTQKSCATQLEYTTRKRNAVSGLQSKTEKDAKTIMFDRSIVRAFKKMPEFFRPVYDTSSSLKTNISFTHPVGRGANSLAGYDAEEELNSSIDWRSSDDVAYDGSLISGVYIGDEIFKTKNSDIRERHRVVKRCCTGPDRSFIGHMIYTSTCEEIEGKVEDYIQFWEDSDQTKKDEKTGKTKTGLYRLFIPANELGPVDRYGICDAEATLQAILDDRAQLKSDPIAYNSEVRKEPLTVEEAFRSASTKCHFDSIALLDRLDVLNFTDEKDLYERGNFEWKNAERDTEVVWVPSKNGRFKVTWLFESGRGANNVKVLGDQRKPQNGKKFLISVDPFDHYSDELMDQRKASDGAFYVLAKFDINNVDIDNMFIVEYRARPKTPQMFYEDVIKAAHYFSSPVIFETQKQGIRHYFDLRGYGSFLMRLPNRREPGIPSTHGAKELLVEETIDYVTHHLHKVNFKSLINDWLNFDINRTQKYDSAMAAGWALVAKKQFIERRSARELIDVGNMFRRAKFGALT